MAELVPDLEISLERVITAPHDARSAIRGLLGEAAEDGFWQNASGHERDRHPFAHQLLRRLPPFGVALARVGLARVEVTDGGGEMPSLVADASHPELGGLRLAVLLEVPAAWGIERTPFGRTVWFEIHREG